MADWLVGSPQSFFMIFTTAFSIYAVLMVLTRLSGLRSFSKLSGFDFAITVAFGSIMAAVVLAKDPPLLHGIVALGSLFALQMGFAALRHRFDWIEAAGSNTPRLIMIGKEFQRDLMAKAKITEKDLLAKLREANVIAFDQVIVVIAETTGDVSVLHRDPGGKDKPFDTRLIQGVDGADRFPAQQAARNVSE